MGLNALKKMGMLWNRAVLLSGAIMLFSGSVFAEKVSCPDVLTINAKNYRMYYADVFVGPPSERASLLPDTDDEMVWTLQDSQDYAKAHNTSMFLVCHYKGTDKTITVRVPVTAKKCTVWFESANNHDHGDCE
ncbi:hypothetical protein GA0061071_10467 [Kosakonia oryzendophytica]|uniref:Peptidase A1 domain-containing protein n=2 Tax=Kosakonia oryzendophytica TaxID=1005665 RepID=A0A1C4B1Z8_9ENTR|nr:hypothetical protein GA0061071_10467 [Kosakonia oryzendophytica]